MKFLLSSQARCLNLLFPSFQFLLVLLLESSQLSCSFGLFGCCRFGNFVQTPLGGALLFRKCMLCLGQTILSFGQLRLHILQMSMLLRHLRL
eukprot:Skav233130  [mRNA]  locus=scaffold792:147544:154916:- [translate_table: standard]